MAIQGTVPVGGSFAPTDSADSFGTHNDKWGVGGHRVVKTTTTRDGIPVNESGLLNLDDDLASGRRKLGMLVYVSDEDKFYILKVSQVTWDGYTESEKVTALADNTNWVEFIGGGGDTGNIGFQDNWIKNTVGEEIYISPEDGYSWLFLPSNTQTSAGNYVNLVNSDPDSGGVYITTSIGSWQFTPSGTTLFPSNALDAGTNSIDIKSSNYAELWFHGEDTVWQANTLSNEDAYVWVDFEGTHIQNYRGADGNGGPEWSYQWQFKNDGILQVPGRISFGGLDWQSIGKGNVNTHGGAYGISLYCTVGYELNWQAGYLAARDYNSPYDIIDIRSDSLIKYATPGDYPTFYSTFDIDTLITKGYLDDQAYLTDAPSDGSTYGRKDGAWEVTTGGIPHATASGTDTYTVTITGVTAYNDGDAYLIRFTNGNTTSSTLNINTLGAKTLYRNNDGPLIGGDIFNGGEMICVYNSGTDGFQCIGSSPNSLFAYVTNGETSTISRGQVVYAFSGTGDRMVVKLASNSGDSTSAKTVGVVYSTSIGANQKGIILMQGLMDGLSILPTSTWADGDSVYLGSTAGSITKTKPYAPNHLVYVATVTTASNGNAGRMYVKIQNGYELDEIHDVDLITSPPTTGHYLYYNGTLWTNSSSWQGSTIAVTKGGTGFSSYTVGDLLYADGTTSLAKLAGVALGSVLVSGGVGAAPSWSNSPEVRSIVLDNATNANTITLQTGATAANYSLTLPTAAPGANQYLQFSSAGVATWVNGTVTGVTTVGTFSASAQTNGATISGSTITFGPASSTVPGMVSTGAQTWAGLKTFSTFTSYGSAQTQAAPTLVSSRSAGSRVLIHEAFSAGTSTDYAIGTESNAMWYSVPQATTTFSHRWYGGSTNIMHLTANGILNLTDSSTGNGAGTAFPTIRSSLSATQSTGNRLTVLSSFSNTRPVVDLGVGVSLSTTATNSSPTYFPTVGSFTNNSLNFVSGSTTSTSFNSTPGSFHFLTPDFATSGSGMASTSNVGFGAGVLPPLVTFRRISSGNTNSTSAIILSAPRGIGTSAISNMTGDGTTVTITLAAGAVSTAGLATNQYIYVSGSTPAGWDSVAGHIATVVGDVITVASTVNPGSFTSATLNYIYRSDGTANFANVFLAFDKDRESSISAAGANLFYPSETRVLWFTKGTNYAGGANGIYALLTNNLYFISPGGTNENDFRPKLTERITFGAHSTNIGIAENVTTGGTLNLGTGVTASGSTKTINLGTGGASGSTTNIIIGSANGTNLGFFGAAGSTRATAYTQTYSTTTKTHSNSTYVAPTGGTTIDTQARTSLGQLAADVTVVKNLINSVIDDLQAYRLFQ